MELYKFTSNYKIQLKFNKIQVMLHKNLLAALQNSPEAPWSHRVKAHLKLYEIHFLHRTNTPPRPLGFVTTEFELCMHKLQERCKYSYSTKPYKCSLYSSKSHELQVNFDMALHVLKLQLCTITIPGEYICRVYMVQSQTPSMKVLSS